MICPLGCRTGLIAIVRVTLCAAVLAAVPDRDPVEHLFGLADAYLGFFTEHANLLWSLFEHRMENDRPFPDDLLQMVMRTFALMHAPMVRLLPDRDPVEVALLARMMFSAAHGIISLGLEARMVAVEPEALVVGVRGEGGGARDQSRSLEEIPRMGQTEFRAERCGPGSARIHLRGDV